MAALRDENAEGQPYLPFRVGYLPKSVAAKAEKELGETEEVRARALAELRKWVKKEEPNLKLRTDDTYLLMYLRPHKFHLESVFKQIQRSFEVKKKHGGLFEKYDKEGLMRTYGLKSMLCLPHRDKEGAVIFMVKMKNWDPDVSSAEEFLAALLCTVLSCLDDPVTQVCGMRILIDVEGQSLKQTRCLAARCLSMLADAFNSAISVRWVGIHVCRESVALPVVWSILSLFLTEKVKSRFHFHGNRMEELHKFIPKAILPVEYGGNNSEDIWSWFNVEAETFLDTYENFCSLGFK